MKKLFSVLVLSATAVFCGAQSVSTAAGSAASPGYVNAQGTAARFNMPGAMCADKLGNIYIADQLNHSIRKVDAAGNVITLAGNGTAGSVDGPAASATFNEPSGIACDTNGNVYVADTKNYKIRMISSAGIVSTISGQGVFGTTNGPVSVAKFGYPVGIAVSPDGSIMYVSDYNTHVIRKIEQGNVTTPAGMIYAAGTSDGIGAAVNFNHPRGLALESNGCLLITDEWNNTIRSMTATGQVTTIAGSGLPGNTDASGLNATFSYPAAICVDNTGNVFVADALNHTIRKIIRTTLQVSTYAGTAGQSGAVNATGTAARFTKPSGIAWNNNNKGLYIGDTENQLIRKIQLISSIQLTQTTANSSVCNGAPFNINISPSNLSGYTVYENGNVIATSATATVSIPALPAGTHALTCTAVDASGAIASGNTLTVTVRQPFVPSVTATNNGNLCPGDSLQLSTPNGSSWLWSDGHTAQQITVYSGGVYTVTATDGSGCSGRSQPFTVNELLPPAATIAASATQVCPGQKVTLTASGGTAYLWSDNSTTQSIQALPGTYSVTVTGNNGCKGQSSPVTVNEYTVSLPVISPAGPVILIQGDTVTLSAVNGTAYTWSNGITAPSVNITAAGYYSVTATVEYGCRVSSSPVQVVVLNGQAIMSATGLTNFCDGDSVVFTSVFTSGNQWYRNNTAIPGANDPVYVAVTGGYYKVGIWQTDHYVFSDSVMVTVRPAPSAPQVNDMDACSNAPVQVTVLNPEPGTTYRWYDADAGGNAMATGITSMLSPFDATTTLYVEAEGSNGCKVAERSALTVTVYPAPQCSFSASSQFQNGQYTVSLINTTTDGDHYTWIFGDTTVNGNVSTVTDPVYYYSSAGTYNIILIADNVMGCSDTLLKRVTVSANNSAFLPTTFTPNNDGRNDVFRVRGDHFTVQEMLIYDQWGTLIFRTDASAPYWDGKASGETVSNGTYVYLVRLISDESVSTELTGSVTVIK